MTLPEDDPSFIMSESRVYSLIGELRAEINRLRIEMHRIAESRRGQRERAERAEAEVERLRADGESGAREILRLGREIERLQAERSHWKPSQCGMIHPVPEGDDQIVRACARKHGHNGPHVDRDGSIWHALK